MAGGCMAEGCTWQGGMCSRRGACVVRGLCRPGGHVWQGGMHGWGCLVEEMATAADGTHPTRMHSSF